MKVFTRVRSLRLRAWRRPFIVTRHWGPTDPGQVISRHRTAWMAWQNAELYRENQANWDGAIMRGGFVRSLFPVVFKVTDTREQPAVVPGAGWEMRRHG